MWRLAITLSVVLFASSAISADANASCIERIDEQIDVYVRHLTEASSYATKKIDKNIHKTFGAHFWNTPRRKLKSGVTELRLTDDAIGFDIVYGTEINDSTCRRFLNNFEKPLKDECTGILRSLMSSDKDEIKAITDTTMKIFDKIKRKSDDNNAAVEAQFIEQTCNDKVEYGNSAGEAGMQLISNVLNRAEKGLDNFVRELIYCLMAGIDLAELLEECSYYMKA